LLNVKFSPNLGDGLLSECLEDALIRQGAARQSTSVDLAARRDYGPAPATRGALMEGLNLLPAPLRQLAVRGPLALQSRRKWGPHYDRALAGADAIVIGGGNLISDHDLNFPTKLARALRSPTVQGRPVAIFGCGVAEGWSREGLRRLRGALSEVTLAGVFLRDAPSRDRWDTLFAPAAKMRAQVVRDPGLLASRLWPRAPRAATEGPLIGLGIMSAVAVRYHSASMLEARQLGQWYLDLAGALVQRGARVMVFTNGSPEDVAAAEALRPELARIGTGIPVERPLIPRDLAGLVAQCDAIAAYRMHAVIAAYSYAVPALALAWDSKLAGFMTSVGRADWLHQVENLSPDTAAQHLMQAAETGLPEAECAKVVAEADADVARLFHALQSAQITPR
jgi:polysaccharide pyruvyl transferase WcaK-like protein